MTAFIDRFRTNGSLAVAAAGVIRAVLLCAVHAVAIGACGGSEGDSSVATGGEAGAGGSRTGSGGFGGFAACGGAAGASAGAAGSGGSSAGSGADSGDGGAAGNGGTRGGAGASSAGGVGGASGSSGASGAGGASGGVAGMGGAGGSGAGTGGGGGMGGDGACGRIELREGWALQSSAVATEAGAVISETSFTPNGWHDAAVPATVVASLVRDGTYPDPTFGMQLRSIPGGDFPIGQNFSNLEFPASSPFRHTWWYRRAFDLPAALSGQRIRLHVDGINYRANLWVNGQAVAKDTELVGTFTAFEFDVTDLLRVGEPNVVALEVTAPTPDDLAMTFVDWMPLPPDKNMGLWRDVYLVATGPVALRHPQVESDLALPGLENASLTVSAELENVTDAPVSGVLRGHIETREFEQLVTLAPRERKTVTFGPDAFPVLAIENPRVWWPHQLGCPELYDLALEFVVSGVPSACAPARFGIRDVSAELDGNDHLAYRVNGEPVQIRGAGWAPDMLLRPSPERERQEMLLVKDMGLNAIRLEGKFGSDSFLDICDEEGILVLAGWCCCDQWELWGEWDAEDRRVAEASLETQVRRLRNHPSVVSWWNTSDLPAPADVEQMYIDVLERERWDVPYASSASETPSPLTGPTGLKMNGPYDYVPPNYWALDKTYGGAKGFNTETSPGAAVPEFASLRRFLPAQSLWPIDSVWEYHAGGGQFDNLALFSQALSERYGASNALADYLRKAQLLAYDGQRALFEAYRRNKADAPGVIQWMLNDGWPKVIWHLFDYYLATGGGYYGTKTANRLLHAQYDYGAGAVVVVSDRLEPSPNLTVEARVLSLAMQGLGQKTATVDVPANGVVQAFVLDKPAGVTGAYFVRLRLLTSAGAVLDDNVYVLSGTPDELDWAGTTWYHTPVSRHSDQRDLASLPEVILDVNAGAVETAAAVEATVTIANPTADVAFQVRLELIDAATGDELLPSFWDDNYVALFPGESRTLVARYTASSPLPLPSLRSAAGDGPQCSPLDVAGLRDATVAGLPASLAIRVRGWNVPEFVKPLAP